MSMREVEEVEVNWSDVGKCPGKTVRQNLKNGKYAQSMSESCSDNETEGM